MARTLVDPERKRAEQNRLIEMGQYAQHLRDNPAFEELMGSVRENLFQRFLGSQAEQEKVREMLWASGQLLDTVRARLDQMIDAGELERANREHDSR